MQTKKIARGRLHLITSCTECQKRKQKCDQEQPCGHCARRFPPPACLYPARQVLLNLKTKNKTNRQPYQNPPLQLVPHLDVEAKKELIKHLNRDRQDRLTGDDVQEPLEVLDAGSVYQKLLSLMLSPLLPLIETEAALNRDNSQISALVSPYTGGHDTESLKRELWQSTNCRIPKACFSISSVEPLHYLPIKPTMLNGELLQIFIQVLTKFVVSIDGHPTPNYYNDEWVPWSIKTPLLAQIAMYTAACYQSEARKIPAGRSAIALRHKLESISLLNETLRNPERSTCDEAIASVVYLTTNEWYWGFRQNVWAHKTGLNEMIKLRGGIHSLENDFLTKTILLCDYHIACSFDIEPSFNYNLPLATPPSAPSSTLCLDNPLFLSCRNLASHFECLEIREETVVFLDDMRFLLQATICQTDSNQTTLDTAGKGKLSATSMWVCNRITSLNCSDDQALSNDFIYQSCRQAALIYCKAINERIPLSCACTIQDLNQLWVNVWRVTLTQWKKIPGIFIWILLSVNQAAQDTPHGRLIKSLLKSASFYIALENWEVVEGTLMAFVRLQRWLRERTVAERNAELLPR